MPRVSVILPNYNHERFLKERIRSILGQSFQDFELILLDDCSTDGSRSILEGYRDHPKVSHVVFNEHNGGSAFRQWEKGISLACGELVWIAESDDSAEPGLLETLVAEFDRNPTCVLAFCQTRIIDESGTLKEIHPIHSRLPGPLRMSGRRFTRKWLCENNCIVNASNALFKSSAFSRIPDSFAKDYRDFRGVGDWLFWLGVASAGDIAFVHEPLGCFRQHGSNTTSSLYLSGDGSLEQARLLTLMERNRLISPCKALRMRVANVVLLRTRDDLPPEKLSACLQAWHAGSPATALWVLYKLTVHKRK